LVEGEGPWELLWAFFVIESVWQNVPSSRLMTGVVGDIGGGEVGCTDFENFEMYDVGVRIAYGWEFILLYFSIGDESELRKSLVMN
jgi:hypothetical protein